MLKLSVCRIKSICIPASPRSDLLSLGRYDRNRTVLIRPYSVYRHRYERDTKIVNAIRPQVVHARTTVNGFRG